MPELPDVEGFRNVLQSCAKGRTIRRVDVRDPGVLHGVSTRRLRDSPAGRRVTRAERHRKWLLARTGGPTLALHFGMTGLLLRDHPDDAAEPHARVLLTVARDHRLRSRDQRKLQGLWPAGDDSDGVVAGLGNLLADEILWRARLRPNTPAYALAEPERHGRYTEMRRTLRPAVTAGRVPPRPTWLTGRRDDPDPHCPRCGTPLRRTRVAGRTTVWCPGCQEKGA
ncbi:DNA-formamidopyrimidine glycosylase family protein [Streptomyces sp. NPDC002285]